MTDPVLLLEERRTANDRLVAVATLNSERSLNALSLDMIRLLHPALQRWEQDDRVVAVVIQGAGEKAFCAGGDVRRIYAGVRENGIDDPYAATFFTEEYRLDYALHRFAKPLIVWGGGIVMGGGMGLLAGASHRIVTESSRLAMPEITIGLYPDVGGSYFLSRLPGRLGLFLGLTGYQMSGADACFTGFATHLLTSTQRLAVLDALVAAAWSADASEHGQQIDGILQAHRHAPLDSTLQAGQSLVEGRCQGDDLAAVYAALTEPATETWLARAGANLAKGSPTSAALIWQQWLRGSSLTLAEVFRQELVISVQCARHHDFVEGVRALLVDKDNQPVWQPATLAGVSPELLAEHDVAPWAGDHPLAALV